MKRFLLISTLFAVAGCPVYGPESDQPPPPNGDRGPGQGPFGPTGEGCFDDRDCAEGSICDFDSGRCFDVSLCVTDGDCPAGSYCEASSGDCLVPTVAMCVDDLVCDAGFECDFRDTCRPEIDGNCADDVACGADQLCVENRCVASALTCTKDEQCPTGAACIERRCLVLCDAGAACPGGTSCDGTLCQPNVGECADSSGCPDLRTNCVAGRCLRRCVEGCAPDIEVCDDEGFCRPRTLPDPDAVAPLCTIDGDCNGSACVDGICRASCDPAATDANATCEAFDGQLPICGADGFCYAE